MRRPWPAVLAVALAAALAPAVALAQPRAVIVRVVDVAGGMAYVEPGESAGLAVGTEVTIGRARFKVVAVSATGAALELGKRSVDVGDRGNARVTPGKTAASIERLPAPRPLSEFKGQWHAARVPAASQRPTPVPLGRAGDAGAVRGAVFARAEAIAPSDGDALVTGWLGARVSADPVAAPLGLDAEGALMLWAGDGLAGLDASHRLVRVRELRLRYGAGDPRVQLGRLRWASSFGGPLDGARVAAPIGGIGLAAWGGLVPDEISGAPSTEASAFGVEASWDRPDRPLRPRLAVAALGTTFDGALDERKLAANASIDGDRLAAGGHLELASFPGDDPFDAPVLEVSSAGADLRLALDDRGGYLAAHGGARRPERSRRLLALLPLEWLCRPSPRPPGTPEPCVTGPLRSELGAAVGLVGDRLRLDAGVTGYHLAGADLALEATGFAALGVRRLPFGLGLDLDLDAGRVDFLDWLGGGVALSLGLLDDRLDVGARYRLTGLRYNASVAAELEHRVGARTRFALSSAELAVDGELVRGGGADALIALVAAIWRLP